jgi:DNA-binding MarR family transcriptional regulator
MTRTSASRGTRSELTESILELYDAFCAGLLINLRDSWLSVELTMPQVKVLLLVVTSGSATTSWIAKRLGVSLPSATRFIDRLVEHGLVAREEDPHDRRYTNLVPTAAARQVVERLNSHRREYLGAALAALGLDQLQEVQLGLSHLVAVGPGGASTMPRATEPSLHG